MTFLAASWLAILVSTVLVFVTSAVSNMLLPHHKNPWSRAPDERALQAALRDAPAGLYAFPEPTDPAQRRSPEFLARWAAGPSGFITVVPRGPFSFGRNLGLSFLLELVISFFTAYVVFRAFGAAAPGYHAVFRLTFTIGFMTYALAPAFDSIWYGKPWRSWVNVAIDGVLYALVMAGTFGWLWPR
ncbi:MAG: hypothetical protein QM704_26095 [Anaeromyxobacteraceae bacterium]